MKLLSVLLLVVLVTVATQAEPLRQVEELLQNWLSAGAADNGFNDDDIEPSPKLDAVRRAFRDIPRAVDTRHFVSLPDAAGNCPTGYRKGRNGLCREIW